MLVAARFGALYENDGYRPGPIVWRFNAGSWSAAHLAASGILARLVARLQSGKGGAAHTSLFQGHMVMLSLIWARNSAGPMPNNPPHPLAARPIGQQLYECQGGDWLQIMDPPRQYDYANMPTMWEVLAEGVEIDTEEGKIEAFRRRPLEAWLADLRADDIAAEPAYPLGGMLRHDDVVANGYAIEVDDPLLGKTIQPNVPFHVSEDLTRPAPAPRLGEGGKLDRPADRAVAPADRALVLGVAVLGIVDEQIDALGQLVARDPVRLAQAAAQAQGRLMVGQVGEAGGGAADAEADRRAGVADQQRVDLELTYVEAAGGHLVDREVARQIAQAHREQRW